MADVLAVIVSGWVAGLIYLELPGYKLGLVLAALLCLVLFPPFGMYRAWRGASLGEEIQTITLAWATTLVILTFLAFVTKTGADFSRGWFLLWLALGWISLVISRIALRLALRELRRRGFNQRRIVIVGSPAKADELERRLAETPWAGLVVVGRFEPTPDGSETSQTSLIDCNNDYADLVAFVGSNLVDQVWIAVPLRNEATIHHVQHALRHSTVDIRYLPDISGFQLLNNSVTTVAGLPVISLSWSGMNEMDQLVKRIEDVVLATLILLLISPLMLLIALGVRLSSPGPALFRQRRLGLGGDEIVVLKFRSMVVHSESPGCWTQARKGDPRITPFGAFLRRTSLDELPQFLNVLSGKMSIVGPRPHPLALNEQYKSVVDRYMVRHKIKPGITGWAQIHGYRGETDKLEKMQKRVEYDLYYIENWSLWMDLKIIALTPFKSLSADNAY